MKRLSQVTVGSTKRAQSFAKEFKEFAFKGSLVDMAMAVVIGGAFGKLLDSFVKNIIMPAISLVMPAQQGYLEWKLTVGEKAIPYGLFIGDVVTFLLIALTMFIFLVKIVGWLMRTKQQEATAPDPVPLTKDQELLTEIRDLLGARGAAAE
ncbi:MAG: large conductance mechanosensitive channel protein MscL [Candidatus Hydrogenedentes bacterium]|nr:large conductance mechanosensitive channel protein MscL [Candidatus Hydrogenedentota bacterium]